MDNNKQSMEPKDLDVEELGCVFEDINVEDIDPISRLPAYMPPQKSTSKVTKGPNAVKYNVFTLLLPEDIPIEGELLAWIPSLKMEDWDLNDHGKYPQFDLSQYLKFIYYEKAGVTHIEPMKWAAGIEFTGLLNMLYVPHFGNSIINAIYVHQLLALVHDGCLWLGEPIPIDEMLIK